VDGVNLNAINDALMLENGIYYLLWKYMRDQPYYANLVEIFHEAVLKTAVGRTLDTLTHTETGAPIFDKFTMDRYSMLARFKSSFYSFVLPMSAGMYVSGITKPELHRQAKIILLDMGEFYQTQDDFLDCYGDPGHTGKFGTDIQDGAFSWLAVVYLQRATSELQQIFKVGLSILFSPAFDPIEVTVTPLNRTDFHILYI
jgi:farnesyl diphosphate synthase